MHISDLIDTGKNLEFPWPSGNTETYAEFIDYRASAADGSHDVRIAFGSRPVYGQDRVRVLVLLDGYPHAEFFGADDFVASGEVLSEVKVKGEKGEKICRYPDEPVPERYVMFNVVGLPTRVKAKGVHSAWAVAASIADHKAMIALGALRRAERLSGD